MSGGAKIRSLRLGRGPRWAVFALNGTERGELQRALRLARARDPTPLSIAVDGGLTAWRDLGRIPRLVVGDADSVHHIPDGIETVGYPREKDFSDLAAALGVAGRRGVNAVAVAGLIGGRLDHEWANLQELGAHAAAFDGLVAPSARGLVVVTARGCELETRPGKTVSLLVLSGAATITLRGTRWTLSRNRLRPGSRGLSNITGDRLRLTVHAGTAALVFPA